MSVPAKQSSIGSLPFNSEPTTSESSKLEMKMASSQQNSVPCPTWNSSSFEALKSKFEAALKNNSQNAESKKSSFSDQHLNSTIEATMKEVFSSSANALVNNYFPKVDASKNSQAQIQDINGYKYPKLNDNKLPDEMGAGRKSPTISQSHVGSSEMSTSSNSMKEKERRVNHDFGSPAIKKSEACTNLNGDLMKSAEHLKALLSSSKMLDFPDQVLISLLELHKETSVIPLILANRKTQKLLNLSDEIYRMSIQSNFSLADLKLNPDDPAENLKVVSLVASVKQHAKYITRQRSEKHPFHCKACDVFLGACDVGHHFSGSKHHHKVLKIEKFTNSPTSIYKPDIEDHGQIPTSYVIEDRLVQSMSNAQDTVVNCSIPPSPLHGELQKNSSIETLKLSEEDNSDLSPDIFSHFQSIGFSEVWCKYCKTSMTGLLSMKNINLQEHVRGAKHRSNVSQPTTKPKSGGAEPNNRKYVPDNKSPESPLAKSKSVSKSPSEKYVELMSSIMKKHIKGEVPLTLELNDVELLGYYCDICCKLADNDEDWLAHLDNHDHKRNAAKYASPTCLYHCLICKIVIFCSAASNGNLHDHVFSSEHNCIKKLVEKRIGKNWYPEIQKHIQKNQVLTIKANKSCCNSVCLNIGEKFADKDGESTSSESKKKSRTNSSKSDESPLWVLPQNSSTQKRHRLSSNTENDDRIRVRDHSSNSKNNSHDCNEYSETDSSFDEYEDKDVEDLLTELFPDTETRESKKDGKTALVKTILSEKKKNTNKINAEGTPTNQKKTSRKRDRPGHVLTFKGIDTSVSGDEWNKRFAEMGRLKAISINFDEGKATVNFTKRSSVFKILGHKDNFLNKYKLQVDETAEKNLDKTCMTLFENEHEFMNKILSTLNIIDDELNLPDSKLRLSRLKTSVLCAIRSTFPDCKIYEFGSRVSGLATNESDYDLFLDLTGTMYQGTKAAVDSQVRIEMIKAIRKITNIFRQMPNEFTALIPITSARVPILKFKHVKTNSNCDLSFKNGLSVENTKLVRKYLNMDPKVRWLVIAVKSWAHTCGLLSSSDFTTYAITWLVLFFLMSKKLVPSVAALMNKNRNVPLIQGWRCNFDNTECRCEINDSNVQLLLDFFVFYESFEFWKYIICTRSGTHFRKFILVEKVVSMMPNEIKDDYCSSVSKSDRDKEFNVGLCSVQDPFDLSHNITKQVRQYALKSFQRYCLVAASQIRKWPPFQV